MEKRLLITDDHAIVRKGVVSLLREHFPFFVFDEAEDAAETVAALRKYRYDLLVLDLNLPDANVEKVVRQVRQAHGSVPIIIFSMFPEEVMQKPLQPFGICAYINKGSNLLKLRDAVQKVLLKTGAVHNAPEPAAVPNPFAQLSPKELLVTFALLAGKNNRQVGEELDLSPSTVATYKQRIFEKLAVRSMPELTRLALAFEVHLTTSVN